MNSKRRWQQVIALGGALLVAAALLPSGSVRAQTPVGVVVNGQKEAIPGVVIVDGVSYGPAEEILPRFGFKVEMASDRFWLRAFGRGTVITLVQGRPTLYTPAGETELPRAPFAYDNYAFMVPLRLLFEAYGARVSWDEEAQAIVIDDPDRPPYEEPQKEEVAQEPAPQPRIPFTEEDLWLLAKIIYAEAPDPDEPFLGQVAVGAVVINRVLAPGFPKTIRDVIYAPGQFQGIRNELFAKGPSASALQAAKAALYGEDPTRGALFFYDPRRATSKWIFTLPVTVEIGHHRFARAP
ncbi:MAG: cell wall hydrolase [Clostridiales bacterium]|nr:cell wall hydrolase [Clostridiales bacterium]